MNYKKKVIQSNPIQSNQQPIPTFYYVSFTTNRETKEASALVCLNHRLKPRLILI
ncbi:hypothetical protein QMK38_06220 [Lysinibacillus fusiformis]|nr:hypothetical protein [Lysinibacillus fusiformis]